VEGLINNSYDDSRGTPTGNGVPPSSTSTDSSSPSSGTADPAASGSLDSSASSGNNSNTSDKHAGRIAGAAVGGLGIVAIAGIGLFFWWRRRKQARGDHWYDWDDSKNPPVYRAERPQAPPTPPGPQPQLNYRPSAETLGQMSERSTLDIAATPSGNVSRGTTSERSSTRRNPLSNAIRSWHQSVPRASVIPYPSAADPSADIARSPKSTASSSTFSGPGTILPFSPMSPSSGYSESYFPAVHTFPSPFSQLASQQPTAGPSGALDPSTPGSVRDDPRTNARLEAQVRALALEVSMLRSEHGTMITRRTSLLSDLDNPQAELPPMYEDHGEDDLISHSDR